MNVAAYTELTTWYDVALRDTTQATAPPVIYNFVTAGYTLGNTLNDLTKGVLRLYVYDDETGAIANIIQGGVPIAANGLYFTLHASLATVGQIVWNVPNNPGTTLRCKIVFEKTNYGDYVADEFLITIT